MYLLLDQALTLIDTGLPRNGRRILTYIERVGRQPEELEHIIVTHAHIDHCGSAPELQAATGAGVMAHAAEVEVTPEGDPCIRPRMRRYRPWMRRFLRRPAAQVTTLLVDGDLLPCLGGLRIIHTPGHTPGSICLYLEKSRVLFTGDLVLNNDGRLSRPFPHPDGDTAQLESSLQRLAELDVEVGCFAHGKPLAESVGARLRDLAAHPPTSPLWWRATKHFGRLLLFPLRLARRSRE